MRKITLSEIFNKRNVSRVIAVLLVLTLLSFAGCDNGKDKGDNNSSTTSSQNESVDSSVDSTPSDDASSEQDNDGSSDVNSTPSNNKVNTVIDPLKGYIDVKPGFSTTLPYTDFYEVDQIVDPSNLANKYKGYAEDERNKLQAEILNTKNTLELYDIKGKVYYVSTSGNDDNDGTSPEKAIASVGAVNNLPLQEGDAVLFERDCIFRVTEPFYCKTGITYGSYGEGRKKEGRKPIFIGSPSNFADVVWKPTKKRNVWETGYMFSYASGAFFNQGEEIGYMKSAIGELTKNTEFFCDTENSVLYLYCDKGNPANVWDSIEFSQSGIRFNIPTNVSNVTIDNICFRFFGEGTIRAEAYNHHLTVTNCEIGFSGGAWHGAVRYGNSIEAWSGGWDLNWSHNWIYQTFDSAVSPQSEVGGDFVLMDNINISNNLFEYNNCDIEYWEHGSEKGLTPSRFKDWTMENNICRFTSLGWGTRPDDGGIRGIDGVFFGRSSDNEFINVNWKNNIIDCPGRMVYNFGINTKEQYDGWIRENNTYYIKQSLRTTNNFTAGLTMPIDSIKNHAATTEDDTVAAFKKFEPNSKVYWYK